MELHLYEELLLLALRDDKGNVPSAGAWYKQAIGGAILSELMLEQRLALEPDGKSVKVQSNKSMGDALIDDCLQLVAQREKLATLQHWLSKFASQAKLLARAAESLCAKGILSEQKSRILWIFESCKYPELNHEPERLLLERLERAIFGEPGELDARTVTVLSLAHRTGLLNLNFDKKELKARKAHIEALVEQDCMGEVAKKVIDSITAAIMVSTIIVPIVAT